MVRRMRCRFSVLVSAWAAKGTAPKSRCSNSFLSPHVAHRSSCPAHHDTRLVMVVETPLSVSLKVVQPWPRFTPAGTAHVPESCTTLGRVSWHGALLVIPEAYVVRLHCHQLSGRRDRLRAVTIPGRCAQVYYCVRTLPATGTGSLFLVTDASRRLANYPIGCGSICEHPMVRSQVARC